MSSIQITFEKAGGDQITVGSITVKGCYEAVIPTTTPTTTVTTTPPYVCVDDTEEYHFDYASYDSEDTREFDFATKDNTTTDLAKLMS